ncbi:MAG: SUMF1/EgtB/PvdO family nonheme iron enzyme [Anaerolineales bacterium]|nr:SUMF1/EgtB/PvdO family nonheme iron enzyme [Anaerolineales bacterium]
MSPRLADSLIREPIRGWLFRNSSRQPRPPVIIKTLGYFSPFIPHTKRFSFILMTRPLRVFLCHSAKDKAAVRELYQKLRTETWIDPWLDEEKLLPGQDWHEEIEKAVEVTDVVIVLLSNQSVSQEGYVHRELKLALDVADEKPENTIFIIPLRLEDCPAPRRLRGWHYEDYFPADRKNRVMERLIASLKLRAKSLGLPVDSNLVEHEFKDEITRKKRPNLNPRLLGIGGVILFVLFLGGFGLNYFVKNLPVPTVTAFLTVSTLTPTRTPVPTSTLGIGSIMISEKDGMVLVYVPTGGFIMGNDSGDDHEKPTHMVYLNIFWIDETEVTNEMYARCINDGVCSQPINDDRFRNSSYAKHPVVYTDWNMANAYCSWAGRKLPTEAQWEKAARSTEEFAYPWGNDFDGSIVNFCDFNCSLEQADKNVIVQGGVNDSEYFLRLL